MRLEDQVCSLELAKQLKKLGIKQESLFYWTEYDDMGNKRYFVDRKKDIGFHTEIICSAFTVAELGEMLPMGIVVNGEPAVLTVSKVSSGWVGGYEFIFQEEAETEADARAKMLIWLIENKYINLPAEEGIK